MTPEGRVKAKKTGVVLDMHARPVHLGGFHYV
jgi:hypothetical protein